MLYEARASTLACRQIESKGPTVPKYFSFSHIFPLGLLCFFYVFMFLKITVLFYLYLYVFPVAI